MQPDSDTSPIPPAPPPMLSNVVTVSSSNPPPSKRKLFFAVALVLLLVIGIGSAVLIIQRGARLKSQAWGQCFDCTVEQRCDAGFTCYNNRCETLQDAADNAPKCSTLLPSATPTPSPTPSASPTIEPSVTPISTTSPQPSSTPTPLPSATPEPSATATPPTPTSPPTLSNIPCNGSCSQDSQCESGFVCYLESGSCRKSNNITDSTCGSVGSPPQSVASGPTPTPVAQLPKSGSTDSTWFIGLGGLLLLGTGALLLL